MLVGGLLGTALRLGLDSALPHSDDAFPLSTLIINVCGAFLLGALVSIFWPTAPGWLKAGLGAGLLGSFTTFSALAVGFVSLTAAGNGGVALAYLALALVLGFGATALGLALGRSVGRTGGRAAGHAAGNAGGAAPAPFTEARE